MDTLLDLRDAFKKIIVDYKNVKCLEDEHFGDSVSIEECIAKVKKIETSKIIHLTLFQKIIKSIDELSRILVEEKPNDLESLAKAKEFRQKYKGFLINALNELYKLNHQVTYYCQVPFGGTFYELTTMRSLYYLGYALTELGECVRERLLIPLNASGVADESEAFTNIESKLNVIFDTIEAKEQLDLDVRLEAHIRELEQKLKESDKKIKASTPIRVGFWDNHTNQKKSSVKNTGSTRQLRGMKSNG